MELLMILTYAAICVAVFKIFRIPVNKWTLPTAVLGGFDHIADMPVGDLADRELAPARQEFAPDVPFDLPALALARQLVLDEIFRDRRKCILALA